MPAAAAPLPNAFSDRFSAALISRIGAPRYHLWFPNHTRVSLTPDGVELLVASEHFQSWLDQTFGDAVRAAAAIAHGGPIPVRFVVDLGFNDPVSAVVETVEEVAAGRKTLFGVEPPLPPHPRPRKPAKPEPAPTPRPGRRYRSLADFVPGPCNRVAHAAAVNLIEDPAGAPNPLVIHGPVGTGKTHLLEGIVAGFRKAGADARPTLASAEEFTAKFVQAARFNKHGPFRRQFRECSALLLDDLHFLATKRATQEEFLHTFDALVAEGKPVVVTLDCHPRLADDLLPELADRLLGGAVWGLMPPDDGTRLELLRQKAAQGPPAIPDDVLKYLARHLRGNVRELEGAIHSVRHYARVVGKPVDLGIAREALGDLLRHAIRSVTVADVDAAVRAVVGLPAGSLQAKARTWAVSHPRMVAVYLCRKHTVATYGEIAAFFGAKQHSTAVAGEKKVRSWLARDERLPVGGRDWGAKELVERVERELLK